KTPGAEVEKNIVRRLYTDEEMRCDFSDVARRCRMSQDRAGPAKSRWRLRARTAGCAVHESAVRRSTAGNRSQTDRTFSHTADEPTAAAFSGSAAVWHPPLRSSLPAGNPRRTAPSSPPLPANLPGALQQLSGSRLSA